MPRLLRPQAGFEGCASELVPMGPLRARAGALAGLQRLDVGDERLQLRVGDDSAPAVAVGLLPSDQRRELERLGNRHAADLSRGHLGEDEVVAFQRPSNDGSRVALRGRPVPLRSGAREV
jgi:hypothetical protein